jgi:hypothetical protein
MASEPILAVDSDIDDQIVEFCNGFPTLQPAAVVRDIARIVCIANLVRNGTLDGKNMVLCGGMAMRCLESPRMSIYDGDTASRIAADPEALRLAISYDEPEIAIAVEGVEPGKDLITFQPVTYTARFSELPGARDQFSLSVAHRGIELPSVTRSLRHRYPFPLLAEEVEVPIMHPDEILAEKIVAWWLFGHAKHYNDIAFLGILLGASEQHMDPRTHKQVQDVVEEKLAVNAKVSERHKHLVEGLTPGERQRRLTDPDGHVDPKRSFNLLSFFLGERPSLATLKMSVDRYVMPVLFQ